VVTVALATTELSLPFTYSSLLGFSFLCKANLLIVWC
jgi:hypothetical protein